MVLNRLHLLVNFVIMDKYKRVIRMIANEFLKENGMVVAVSH